MKPLLWIAATLVSFPFLASGTPSGSIIQVSTKLRMSAAELEAPRDYYVDLGVRDGVNDGDVLEVSRVYTVSNGLWGGPAQLMRAVLGQIKVMSTENTVCRARILNRTAPEELPILEYSNFMLGDEVRTKTGLPSQPGHL